MKLQRTSLWLFSLTVFFLFSFQLCENGRPSQPLVDVLDAFGIDSQTSWDEIVAQTQSKWLRPSSKELWQVGARNDPHPEHSYRLFSNLEMMHARYPSKKQYDYAVILGATVGVMQARFNFLMQEWDKGVRFNALVWLVGDRPIDPSIETMDGATNETQAAQYLFAKCTHKLREVPVVFVDTPKKPGQLRPTTLDTFSYWKESNPLPGSALIVGSAPFMNREELIAKKTLPGFDVEVVGKGVTLEEYKKEKRSLAIVLDELARWIYSSKCETQ